MSITPPRPQMPSFVPESAPFTLVQRAWFNGLFAGVFGVEGGVTPLSKQDVAKLFPAWLTLLPTWPSPSKTMTARLGTTRQCRCPTA